jgi:D-alanine-D-alanine ligase
MGGPSSEREISLKSGAAVLAALKERGVEAVPVDITTDDAAAVRVFVRAQGIDCAFIALHGHFGEDGQLQAILEQMDIPYTGSGVMASRLAMDKISSRAVFAVHKLSVPQYSVVEKTSFHPHWVRTQSWSLPLVIKPATQGSSIGLSIVDQAKDIEPAVMAAFAFDERVIIEEYVRGRELTVGVLDEKPLPVIEIIPKRRFFDYEAKYQAGMTEYVVPAVIDPAQARIVQKAGVLAHRLLGCRGYSRVDIILRDDNTPFVLEVNTIPGMTATSLLPKAARVAGIDFPQLCAHIIELAYGKG